MNAILNHASWRIDNRLDRERHEDIRLPHRIGSYKSLRHNPDNGEGVVGNLQLASQNVGRAVEPSLPELLTDHYGQTFGIASNPIVSRSQVSSQQCRRLQCIKVTAADQHSLNAFIRQLSSYLHLFREESKDAFKDLMPCLERAKEWSGEAITQPWFASIHPQDSELIGVRHGKRPQQQAVDQGENRRIGAHPESQRKQRDCGESR